jgi:pimeloyl-ACP methyl ester carboxylesterase
MDHDQRVTLAVQKWFEVLKVPHDASARAFVRRCQAGSVELNSNHYTFYQRGTGPTIVLIHGLFSNLGSMIAIAQDLMAREFRVVLFDAPAHGEARGTRTDPLEVSELIRRIGKQLGDIHAVICHSLGVMWALAAWNTEFRAKTLISISGLSNQKYLVDKFIEKYRIGSDVAEGFIKAIEQRFGDTVWIDWSPAEMVKALDIPGLIIHGTQDDVVPPAHAEHLHANWSNARVEMIDGVGHLDIMGSLQTRRLITTYLQEVH